MKPVENYEAERAYRSGKHVFVLDRVDGELIYLNKSGSVGFITDVFTKNHYLYYIYE